MRAYSMDLRKWVFRDSDAGMTSVAVAEKYDVSRAWVDRLKQRRRETVAPRAVGQSRRSGRCWARVSLVVGQGDSDGSPRSIDEQLSAVFHRDPVSCFYRTRRRNATGRRLRAEA